MRIEQKPTMADDTRDQVLVDFQAFTGIEDFDTCAAILEQHDWKLEVAVNSIMPSFEAVGPPECGTIPSGFPTEIPAETADGIQYMSSPMEEIVNISDDESTAASGAASAGPSSSYTNIRRRLLNFTVEYRDRNIPVIILDSETVGSIKEVLEKEINVPASQQIIKGIKRKFDDTTVLKDLHLPKDNTLYVLTPQVRNPTLSRSREDNNHIHNSHDINQEYKLEITLNESTRYRMFNLKFPGSKTVHDVKQDLSNVTDIPVRHQVWTGWPTGTKDSNIKDKKLTTDGQLRKDRNVSRLFEERKLTKFVLGLYTSVLPLLKQYVLMFEMKEPKIHLLHEEQVKLFTEFLQCFMRPEVLADNCSPKKLKTVDVSNLPFILPEKDLFIGSKAGTMLQLMKPDQKKKILSQLFLSQCGLNLPTHDLTVAKNNNSTNNKSKYTSEEAVMELSSDEDEIIDSFPEEDIFVPESESTSSRRTATLMPEAFADDSEALEHFTREFSERYGDTHPVFYIGSLDDAIKESLQVRARDRKLLAIYLHHDSSIFSNVFCSQILCSEVIVNYLTTNFITWGWDLTHEANTSRLLTSATRHFGSVAGTQMRNYKTEELPALLIISRSRATNEIVDVIQGHVTLDELMTRMIHSVQIFQEQQSADIAEEQERAGRELIKQQQDAAYEESLAADRAKAEIQREEEAQRQAILEVEIEKQREVERLQQEEEHAKKTIQQNISEQLAPEPPKDAAYPISNIRFRVQGEVITRRFRADDTIQTLLNFLITKGFHTEEYKVLTTFPRRDITQLDQSQTLQDVKLYPQETLILEEKS